MVFSLSINQKVKDSRINVATQIYHLSGKLQALQTPWGMPFLLETFC